MSLDLLRVSRPILLSFQGTCQRKERLGHEICNETPYPCQRRLFRVFLKPKKFLSAGETRLSKKRCKERSRVTNDKENNLLNTKTNSVRSSALLRSIFIGKSCSREKANGWTRPKRLARCLESPWNEYRIRCRGCKSSLRGNSRRRRPRSPETTTRSFHLHRVTTSSGHRRERSGRVNEINRGGGPGDRGIYLHGRIGTPGCACMSAERNCTERPCSFQAKPRAG